MIIAQSFTMDMNSLRSEMRVKLEGLTPCRHNEIFKPIIADRHLNWLLKLSELVDKHYKELVVAKVKEQQRRPTEELVEAV
ncbi:hypothetical protein Zmor_019126 [Zophobas morio]|uniref:Uncharacterized protein n=1 Tax=Zophobas morio TaxID=2755281 RepID=A0AA38HL93_9CUCU|nr:hypothetical protein Zmor_019126 [Zophobas morio]